MAGDRVVGRVRPTLCDRLERRADGQREHLQKRERESDIREREGEGGGEGEGEGRAQGQSGVQPIPKKGEKSERCK